MFEDSLLESSNRFRTHHRQTTAVSLALQTIVLGGMVLLPLIYTDALPRMQTLGRLLSPPPPAPSHGTRVMQRSATMMSQVHDGRLLLPLKVPAHAQALKDPEVPNAPTIGVPWGVKHSTGPLTSASTLISVLNTHTSPPPAEPRVERLNASRGVTEGHLVHRVEPEYPMLARQNRIEGDVLLRAVIGRDGRIENLSVVSGNPFLTRAALEAVTQWRYQPFLLNGRAVEVDTQVLVRFRFARN